MDGALWPVAIVEKIFTADRGRYTLTDLAPVPHYLIDYTTGFLRINDVDPASGMILPTSHPADPARYIIHRGHLLSTPDTWGGPLRSILFWWLLSTMDREWWARFLDRYGSPFLVGKYRKGDDSSKAVLRSAFALAVKLGGLVINEDTSVELQQAASAGSGDAYEKFLAICQREKSKLILGQTLSSEAQSTGMNSGVATMQEGVRQDIREWDAHTLGDTLRLQLFSQFLQINRISAGTPSAIWGSESPAALMSTAALLTALYNAGVQLADDGIASISRRTGLPLERRQLTPGLTQAALSAALRPLR
jgi:phage gp29-like protein